MAFLSSYIYMLFQLLYRILNNDIKADAGTVAGSVDQGERGVLWLSERGRS
jgi:hypothetical protein